jgi:hypothetical protein
MFMPTLKEIERVFACEVNEAVSPPFPVSLPASGTVDLCRLTVPLVSSPSAFLVTAVVNWSVTFTPTIALNSDFPGFTQITFELLRDGGPIQRVIQSAIQLVFSDDQPTPTASTTFKIATLRHLDTTSLGGIINPLATFVIRATNIILNPPLNVENVNTPTPVATVTAAAGLTSLTVEEVGACRADTLSAS